MAKTGTREPALFISHGSPTVALLEDPYTEALARSAAAFSRPASIIVMSAHWTTAGPIQITSSEHPETIHDFGGFPDALYEMKYPCAGAPALAKKIESMLREKRIEASTSAERGLDHGAWIPLRIMYPEADIPVVQVSLPFLELPRRIMQLGNILAPLRDEGVLLIGSGGAVHNLRRLRWDQKNAAPELWAVEFDRWVHEKLRGAKIEDLLSFDVLAPHAKEAHPTTEHFLPLFFTAGSSLSGDQVRSLYNGFHYGSLSMFSFALSP